VAPECDSPGSAHGAHTTGTPGRDTESLTYGAAIERLMGALRFGIRPSLAGIRALCAVLGDPQDACRCLQVTGTNGKTSVTRMIGAILGAHGVHPGVYTSPHLVSYTERVEVDGVPVTEDELALGLEHAFGAADVLTHAAAETLGLDGVALPSSFTEFELLTAAALWLFRAARCDWAVLEVGMGGRWDATSVVAPSVSVVTGVALDHTERLGTTREEIAADKAYIIKPGTTAVLGPGCAGVEQVFLDRAIELGVPTLRVGLGEHDVTWAVRSRPDVPGGPTCVDVIGALGRYDGLRLPAPSYQAPNLATAIGAAEAALDRPLAPSSVAEALQDISFPGRFELVRSNPPLVLDGAHNPEAAGVLATAIAEAFGANRPTIVLGVLADKDAVGIVRALEPVAARFICPQPANDRARQADHLAAVVQSVAGTPPVVASSVIEALALVADEPAVVTGSLYMAGEARAILLG